MHRKIKKYAKNCPTGYVNTRVKELRQCDSSAGERPWNWPTYILKVWYITREYQWGTDCLVENLPSDNLSIWKNVSILSYLKSSNRNKALTFLKGNRINILSCQ